MPARLLHHSVACFRLPEIATCCRAYTKDHFRFDPLLHLCYDRDPARNAEIRAERLSAMEIAAVEQADERRARVLKHSCHDLIVPEFAHEQSGRMSSCGAGTGEFTVSYDGRFVVCPALRHPDCTYDLRRGSVAEAGNELVPRVRDMRSQHPVFLDKCRRCPIVSLCLWCPANADLETGRLDGWSDCFCEVAHARAAAIEARAGDAGFL